MKAPFPISLRNNCLQDSIITIQYATDYSTNFVETKLLHLLSQNKILSFEKIRRREQQKIESRSPNEYLVSTKYFYADRRYSFEVNDNEIVLNCTREYVGWEKYSWFVSKVLESLDTIKVEYQTIIMQYVSKFPDTDIFDSVDGVLKLNCYPRLQGTQFRFNIPIGDRDNRYNTIVSSVVLTNNLQTREEGQYHTSSYIDIRLQYALGDIPIMDVIEHIHQQEKNLFFSMMSKNFIDSLGSIYQ